MPSPEAYRAVAKRKGAYAAMPVWGYRGVSGFYDPAILTFPFLRSPWRALSLAIFFSVPSVPSVRTLCFDLWNERKGYRAVAKRRSAYAAMPVLSELSVPSARTLFFKTCQLKSWRSQKPCQTKVWRSQGKKKRLRRDAALSVFSVPSVRTLF